MAKSTKLIQNFRKLVDELQAQIPSESRLEQEIIDEVMEFFEDLNESFEAGVIELSHLRGHIAYLCETLMPVRFELDVPAWKDNAAQMIQRFRSKIGTT